MKGVQKICAACLVAGGVNWGLIGLFSFDAIAWICGGALTLAARIIYIIVGAAAVGYILACMLRDPERRETGK